MNRTRLAVPATALVAVSGTISGTGPWEDVCGTCDYSAEYLGERHAVTVAECEWHKP